MRLTEALTRIEERLAAILNDPNNKTHNIEYNPSEIQIPNKDDWKIVLWHFNIDSFTEYSGEKFHCSWKEAKNLFIRVYTKEFQPSKTAINNVLLEQSKNGSQHFPNQNPSSYIWNRLELALPIPDVTKF